MTSSIKPTRRTRRRVAALLALAAVLLSAPVAWALGELSQKPGTAGCVSETGTGGACQDGKALETVAATAASPDGKNLYVASFDADAVAVFDRDPATGALSQRPGTAGCVSEDGTGGLCQDGAALDGAVAVAASPDGESVYVASDGSAAVAVFDRNPATGALTQKPGTAGCVSEDGSGGLCQNGTALDGAFAIAASPDGTSVHVASSGADAVAVFDRNPATGALTQKPGTAGCVSEDGTGGLCQNGTALDGASAIAASPDGESVYVSSFNSRAVAVFDRAPSGALTQKPGSAGCISEDGTGGACQDGTALAEARGVAASPDGTSVYVTSHGSGAVTVFDRAHSGALTQKPGSAGCVSEDGTGGACQDGTALAGAHGVAASPDGTSVYVASDGSAAVAVFDRDPATGALTQKPGLACVSETGTGACQDGTALDGAFTVAVSPDSESVYVASLFSDAVAIFDRATPSSPPPPPPPSPPDTVAPSVTRLELTPSRFRVASAATPTDARAAGRRDPARVAAALHALRVRRRADPDRARRRGRRVGRRCEAPIRKLRERRRCTRYKRAGTLTRRNLPAGRNTIRFSGRIGKRALAPGGYRATVTATDPAGNRSTPTRATFRIARR